MFLIVSVAFHDGILPVYQTQMAPFIFKYPVDSGHGSLPLWLCNRRMSRTCCL